MKVKWVIFKGRALPHREKERVVIIVTIDSYLCVLNILYSAMEGIPYCKDSFSSSWITGLFVCFLEGELILTHSLRGHSIKAEKTWQQEIEVADHIALPDRRQKVINAVVIFTVSTAIKEQCSRRTLVRASAGTMKILDKYTAKNQHQGQCAWMAKDQHQRQKREMK